MTLFLLICFYILVIGINWVVTMLTTMNWTTNGKFQTKDWFSEYRGFLFSIWSISLLGLIIVTMLVL